MSYTLYYFPIRPRGDQIRPFIYALAIAERDVLDAILINIKLTALDGVGD